MTESTTQDTVTAPVRDQNLFARFVGVLFSPRDTFAVVAARPRWFGMLALVVIVMAGSAGWFLNTQVGRDAQATAAEQALTATARMFPSAAERIDEQRDEVLRRFHDGSWWQVAGRSVIAIVVGRPILALIAAGILMLVFNAFMNGSATFKQLMAVVVHSWAVSVVSTLFMTPLKYFTNGSAGASLNLLVGMPSTDGFAGGFLNAIDLFTVWWVFALSVGLAVLYKRRTAPIAISLFSVYAVVALGFATIAAMFAARS